MSNIFVERGREGGGLGVVGVKMERREREGEGGGEERRRRKVLLPKTGALPLFSFSFPAAFFDSGWRNDPRLHSAGMKREREGEGGGRGINNQPPTQTPEKYQTPQPFQPQAAFPQAFPPTPNPTPSLPPQAPPS